MVFKFINDLVCECVDKGVLVAVHFKNFTMQLLQAAQFELEDFLRPLSSQELEHWVVESSLDCGFVFQSLPFSVGQGLHKPLEMVENVQNSCVSFYF